MTLHRVQAGVLVAVLCVGVGIACGKANDLEIDLPGDAGEMDEIPPLDASFPEAPDVECKKSCSADLHDWVDCNGVSLLHCPEDQGCWEGECIPACEAAERNKSTYGCEYYSVDPAEFTERVGSCFAAFVVNTWDTDATIGVEYAGTELDVRSFARIPSGTGRAIQYEPLPDRRLPPNKVAILFLANYPTDYSTNCPSGIVPAVTNINAKLSGTGITSAFRITSTRPVVAYDIYPFGGGESAITSATLLLPTSAWGINYVAQAGYPASLISKGEPFLQVVAKADNTTITIKPAVDIKGNPDAGIASAAVGLEASYKVNRGQVLQISQRDELTGSVIASDKDAPIGVWGGHNCFNIDVDNFACDSAHQQIPPVAAMGHEYVAVKYRDRVPMRQERPPWRIVGLVDDTELIYEPYRPADAPQRVQRGQIAAFNAREPFIVRSQSADHPFYMSAHMTGGQRYFENGDPEWVNLVPPAQWLSRYVFFTDPTYPDTSLVVIRTKLNHQLEDVILDCYGPIESWVQIDADDNYEYAHIDISTAFEGVNGCNTGVHTMTSRGPFTVTVWAWGWYTSYAYPVGAGLRSIAPIVIPTSPQ